MDLRQWISSQADVSSSVIQLLDAELYNYIFSSYPLSVVLAMLEEDGEGPFSFLKSKSVDELNSLFDRLSTVFSDSSSNGGPSVDFSKNTWDVQIVEAAATTKVNQWVDKATTGVIKALLPPGSVDSKTTRVHAAALDFAGAWNETFDASQTSYQKFYLPEGTSVEAPFMTSKKKRYLSSFNPDNTPPFKVLSMRFQQGDDTDFTMFFVLPASKQDFAAVRKYIGDNETVFFDEYAPSQQVEVGNFLIPKFKMTFRMDFSDPKSSDAPLFNDCLIQIDEEGATAIGASGGLHKLSTSHEALAEKSSSTTKTSAGLVKPRSSVFATDLDFVANYPFMIFIRENRTRLMEFVGGVINPLGN